MKLEFDEEKFINQQLIDNQHDLKDEMKKKKNDIKELKDQVNDLILHVTSTEELKVQATSDELSTSNIVITSKPTQARRRK